jgi:hypothetical protein
MSTRKWRQEHKKEMAEYRKKWYSNNQQQYYKKLKERRYRNRDYLNKLKLTLKCELCSQNHPATLQFHHINPKEKDFCLAEASTCGWSIERIDEEIKKCKILCANCHSILHWNEKCFNNCNVV